MTATGEIYVWLVLPYVSLAIFAAGHVWRYRRDQFGWTSRSTQILEGRLLAWGSNLFHYGALAAIGGHVIGILVPPFVDRGVGVTDDVYHRIAGVAGSIAGLAALAGFGILTFRRTKIRRVRVTTSLADVVVFVLLAAMILTGLGETLGYTDFGPGFEYRHVVGGWFRGLFYDPHPSLMAEAPILYQFHAALPWLLYAVWPFSRLVHVWSYPLQYLGRPYILYRNRYAAARR